MQVPVRPIDISHTAETADDAAARRKAERSRLSKAMRRRVRAAMREVIRRVDPGRGKDGQGRQREAGRVLGLDASQLNQVLKRGRIPRIETLVIMRDVLGISIDEMLGLPPLNPELERAIRNSAPGPAHKRTRKATKPTKTP